MTHRRRAARCRAPLFAAALGLTLLAPAAALAEATVYKAQHRPAEELLPLAETAMQGAGSAVVDRGTNSIVLLGTPDAVRQALDLLARQDVRTRTVIVRYEEQHLSELQARGVRVRWSTGSESWRVGNVVSPEDGTRIAVAAGETQRTGDASLAGTLRVLDGGAARIGTGEIVPMATRRATRYGVDTSITQVSAESGFEVRPRVLGDGRVRLDILPFGARVRSDGSIATSEAATTVMLEDGGEPAVIGGLGAGTTAATRDALSGTSSRQGRDERVLLVSVSLE